MTLEFLPICGIPEIKPGADLSAVLLDAASLSGLTPKARDILVVAQKIVSKAEGRLIHLNAIEPSSRARELAESIGKDARLVEVILSESSRVVRYRKDLLITETHHGFVCANAGVDWSNVDGADVVALLPKDPDHSARALRERLGCGIIITDTFGRAWREGLVDTCIGIAGPPVFIDMQGVRDRFGYTLKGSLLCTADALAATAGLEMGKAEGIPAVLIRGFNWENSGAQAHDIVRLPEKDLFR